MPDLFTLSMARVKHLNKALGSYIPRPVIVSLETTNSKWVSELRVTSVLFVRLFGLEFSIDNTHLLALQRKIETLQDAVYRYHGTLCRMIVDDKGCGALVAYGLPPFSNESMQTRAVRGAMGIVHELRKLETGCSIVSHFKLSI